MSNKIKRSNIKSCVYVNFLAQQHKENDTLSIHYTFEFIYGLLFNKFITLYQHVYFYSFKTPSGEYVSITLTSHLNVRVIRSKFSRIVPTR